MLEVDPIPQAQQSLLSECQAVLKGGDPNRLKGPVCALLRAKGQGKLARELMELPALAYVKPVKK